MKEKKLFDAITDIDGNLVEKANIKPIKRIKPIYKKAIAIACTIAIVIGIGTGVFLHNNSFRKSNEQNNNNDINNKITIGEYKPILSVKLPKSVDRQNDFDEWYELREKYVVDENFKNSVNEFSYNTASALLKDRNKNANYSPLSLYYALAIASTGATGDALNELLDVLCVDSIETLNKQCNNLYRLLYSDNSIDKLKISNSVWLNNKFVINDDFVNNAVENFYAESYSVDFGSTKTNKTIEKWISKNTKGKLSPTVETDINQILTIINTIYFKDEWANEFLEELTKPDTFYLADGKTATVDFMHTSNSSTWYKGDGFKRAGLYCKNQAKVNFILPDEDCSVNSLFSSPERLKEALTGGEEKFSQINWSIPKFTFNTKYDLVDTLENLGVKTAFDRDKIGSFNNITTDVDGSVYISGITQETTIELNEKGVESAAYTELFLAGDTAAPEEILDFSLNRPFIYTIEMCDSIVFVGVVYNPTE
ncbi:MAG: serpin family protein [Acutalibacteraceae bacterium]